MNLGFDRKALAVAAVVVLGIGALVALSLQSQSQLRHDVAELDHVGEIQAQTQRIYITLLDLETSQRGYLLTQEAEYLGPYQAGLERLHAEAERLSALVAGQPEEGADLARLRGLIDEKLAELAQTIAVAQTRDVGAALAVIRQGQGKAVMDEIRTVLAHMQSSEAQAHELRDAARIASIDRAKRYIALLATAMALLLLTLAVLVRRDKTLRAQQRSADQAARQELERRVAERTSDLEAALHALALGKARLQGIFDSAADAILTANAQQIIVAANESAATLFRCAHADLIGASLERLIPVRFHEAHRRDVEAFGSGDDRARHMGRTKQVVGLRADGEEFPLEASISHLETGGERLYTVILHDVTQRRQDEATLRESKTQLEAALASMSDAVFISDTEGRFVNFNKAFATFHRFKDKASCARTLAEYPAILEVFLANGEQAPLEEWVVPKALRGESAVNAEFTLRRRDTGESWIGAYNYAPILGEDGNIVGAVVTARDVTAIKRVQAELAASHTALQHLLANQHRIQEEERKRIARELHDDLQQSLAAIRMDAVAVGERIAKGRVDAPALLARIDRLSAAAIASTRRIVSDLRPELLEDLGLLAALEAMCAQHTERSGAECRLELLPGASDAQLGSAAMSAGLYRIAQEALNNVAKHAKATVVTIRLGCSHDGLVMLRIDDNGVGVNLQDRRHLGSFGLRGMAERARALGGQLRIHGAADTGTSVEVLVPTLVPATASGLMAAQPDWTLNNLGGPVAPAPGAGLPRPPDELGQPLQSVIDALAGQVCVLDERGEILMVNRAWRQFAARNGDPALRSCGPGVNYLDVCRRSAETDHSTAPILLGLNEVLDGRQSVFSTVYPCDTPESKLWFRMHVASVTGGLAIVSHVDLGSHVEPDGNDSNETGLHDKASKSALR